MAGGSLISFARGAPSLDIIDADGLRASADRALRDDPAGAFSYGTAIGYPPLRQWIAQRHGVAEEQVIVTNGSMQADAFLFELLVDPGDAVIAERPTYDRTLLSLRARGADVVQVPLEDDGVDVAAIGRLLGDGLRPKLAHIIPNFHNPAGATLSLPKRERLLAVARDHEMLVFEDDPYGDLRFTGESIPTMLAMERGAGGVVYASSFSKTICPGVRVGYLIGPEALVGQVRVLATNTYISPSMVAQAIVNDFCRCGAIDRSVATVREALRERADTLVAALARELPQAEATRPDGGYFLWVRIPGASVDALFDAAAERGVAIVKGTDFQIDGGEDAFRLAYSGVTPDQIEEGVARLAEAVRALAA